MSTWNRWVARSLLATLLVLLAALISEKGFAKAKEPKPVVMLLLDTSGNVQNNVDPAGPVFPYCTETKQSSVVYGKSRWIAITEVLTGTFKDYWCSVDDRSGDPLAEDYNASPPHFVAHGTVVDGSQQEADGIIDLRIEDFKFGLMTFDPIVGTARDRTGGFSYGPDKSYAGGFQANFGAHSEAADWGKLVSPAAQDNVVEIRNTNLEVQEQILASRPYGYTPIGPLLDDALYFFSTDERVKPYDEVEMKGDPFYSCRSKNIILITDGSTVPPDGTYGYPVAASTAAKLLEHGIKVYVIGFQMTEPAAYGFLDLIAKVGGSREVRVAADAADLATVLGEILIEIEGVLSTPGAVTVTNRTLNVNDRQYMFATAYTRTLETPLDYVGKLDQLIYRCDPECLPEGETDMSKPGLCEVFSVSEALNARVEPRMIFTQIDGVLTPFALDNPLLTPDILGVPTSGTLPRIDPVVMPDGKKKYTGTWLGNAADPGVREEYRNQLIKLVAALPGSRREHARLGAISGSRPVVQTNIAVPNIDLEDTCSMLIGGRSTVLNVPIPSFRAFQSMDDVKNRPTVLFVGTHDAQMHAFRVDRMAGLEPEDYGKELWSFIPQSLLPRLNEMASGMTWLMEGVPVTAEIRLYKEGRDVPLEVERDLWRSVLVSGLGTSGRGYFALNVTDPTQLNGPSTKHSGFMWEITNTHRCFNIPGGGSGCVATADYARLGLSTSVPIIGTVFRRTLGGFEERAVVIFGGGEEVPGEPESGHALFVVNLEDGSLIQEFCNTCGNVFDTNTAMGNSEFLDCPLVGAVAGQSTFVGQRLTRAFIGDSCGQLWRLDVSLPDPNDWKLEFFHDTMPELPLKHRNRRRVSYMPALTLSAAHGLVVAVYGTGSDDPLEKGQRDKVYSISEQWDGKSFSAKVNWELVLEPGEAFTAPAVVFEQVAYFTTQTKGKGHCAAGNGWLWGLDYDGNIAEPEDVIDDLVGRLDADGNPFTTDFVTKVEYENVELFGFDIIQKPACFLSITCGEVGRGGGGGGRRGGGNSPPLGTAGGIGFNSISKGTVEMVVHTGKTGITTPEMQPPEGGGSIQTGNMQSRSVQAPTKTMFSTSWGLIFD